MRRIDYRQPDYQQALAELDRRYEPSAQVHESVASTMAAVRDRGDAALRELTLKFDRADLVELRVSDEELAEAVAVTDAATVEILETAHANVLDFAKRGLRKGWQGTNAQGAEVGEVYHPFERVGIYVPGGSAPLVSTVLMTVTLAAAAGVPEIVACTPCGTDGTVNPALLRALQLAGATEIYKLGGAQAIAALAIGTESIRPTAKIFGPGNQYVVEAKRQAFGVVAVDLLPGPSEVLVLADESARADFVAADLLAQAEHGGDSVVGLISTSEAFLEVVEREIRRQAGELSRQSQLLKVLEEGLFLVLVPDLGAGIDLVNAFAPEHLSLIIEDENALLPLIRTAGAIFVGNLSPVAVGDFLAGPSHELPTGGAGKSFPGLTVDMFQRRTSIVRLDDAAIAKSAPIVDAFSKLEGLDAHGRSAMIRVNPS